MTQVPFKMILTELRKQVLAEPDHEWKTFDLAVIDRWQEHGFADAAWQAIEKASLRASNKSLEPGGLVEWIIDQARLHKRLVDEVIPRSEELEKKSDRGSREAMASDPWQCRRNMRRCQERFGFASSSEPHRSIGSTAQPPKEVYFAVPRVVPCQLRAAARRRHGDACVRGVRDGGG